MTDDQRTRTYSWDDPWQVAENLRDVSDSLTAMREGQIPPPPISKTLEFYLDYAEDGKAVFVGTPAEYHYNPIGVVHGAYATALLDSALAVAIQSRLPQGKSATTINLHLTFIRPLTVQTGKVRAIAEVVHLGRQVATGEAKLLDANDKLYCHATGTFMVQNI